MRSGRSLCGSLTDVRFLCSEQIFPEPENAPAKIYQRKSENGKIHFKEDRLYADSSFHSVVPHVYPLYGGGRRPRLRQGI